MAGTVRYRQFDLLVADSPPFFSLQSVALLLLIRRPLYATCLPFSSATAGYVAGSVTLLPTPVDPRVPVGLLRPSWSVLTRVTICSAARLFVSMTWRRSCWQLGSAAPHMRPSGSAHIDSSPLEPLRARVGSPDNTTHSFHQHNLSRKHTLYLVLEAFLSLLLSLLSVLSRRSKSTPAQHSEHCIQALPLSQGGPTPNK